MEPENNQVYRAVFEQAPDAMAVVDSTGNIILLNRKMLEITGYPDEGGLCGKNFTHVIAGPDHDRFMEYLQPISVSSGTGEIREFGFLKKDGSVSAGEFLLSMVPGVPAVPGW